MKTPVRERASLSNAAAEKLRRNASTPDDGEARVQHRSWRRSLRKRNDPVLKSSVQRLGRIRLLGGTTQTVTATTSRSNPQTGTLSVVISIGSCG